MGGAQGLYCLSGPGPGKKNDRDIETTCASEGRLFEKTS